jgi:hypothetical protein
MKRLILALGTIVFLCCLPAAAQTSDEQAGNANQAPQSSPAPLPSSTKHKHHLIELSSKNWHPLKPNEKFELFTHDMISWETHLALAGDAELAYALDNRSYLGHGWPGFGKRYGINVLDEANGVFFQAFLFPVIFP